MATVLVTGGTGLTGANVCQQLIERGDSVRTLVRNPEEAEALRGIGVELVQGDLTDASDVLRAGEGCEAAIHTAALLGGASQNLADFEAVNVRGTVNVLDAAKAHGMRRVVALSTGTFLDTTYPGPLEEAPLLADPPQDPYTVTKMAAFREAQQRAADGQDVVIGHPGAIYGPSIVVKRALHPTSFNRVLLAGLQGKISRYLSFPVTWVAARDVASGSIAALDRGVAGERYWLAGRPEDTVSIAGGCNRACAVAGVEHRVEDLDYRENPEVLVKEFGPTLMGIAEKAAHENRPVRTLDTPTKARLGYNPLGLDDGLQLLVDWLRQLGRL